MTNPTNPTESEEPQATSSDRMTSLDDPGAWPPPGANIKVKTSPSADDPKKDNQKPLGEDEWAILMATIDALNEKLREGLSEEEQKQVKGFISSAQGELPWKITKDGQQIATINPVNGTIFLGFTGKGEEDKETFSEAQTLFVKMYIEQLRLAAREGQKIEIVINGDSEASKKLASDLRNSLPMDGSIKIRHASESFEKIYGKTPGSPKKGKPENSDKPSDAAPKSTSSANGAGTGAAPTLEDDGPSRPPKPKVSFGSP
jgi:hypothetical protein